MLSEALIEERRNATKMSLERGKGKYSCTAGKNLIVLDELGNINPCEILSSKFTFGNIKDHNFNIEEIYKKKRVRNILRRIKEEKMSLHMGMHKY